MKKTSAKPKGHPVALLHGKPQQVPLANLKFDAQNPRTVGRLGDDVRQEEIEEFLLGSEMKALDLVPSFIANGYIPYEPLIVMRERGEAHYVVVEGNRRLAALRSMRVSNVQETKDAFLQHGLSEVPCLIFDGNERQLLAYLGLRHLSKTKDWTTTAKGAFVERILKASTAAEPADRLREAGNLTNTTTNSLRLILLTRRMFDRAGALGLAIPSTGADGETTFWHLGDALRRSNTKAYLKLEEDPDPLVPPQFDEDRFEKLATWLYGSSKTKQSPLIQSIRDIPNLNTCLGSLRAIRSLENGSSLREALEELEAAGATVSANLERAKKSIQRAGTGLSEVDEAGLSQVEEALVLLQDAVEQFTGSLQLRISKIRRTT